ncbi:tripartite tricarboxylate transporter substrate binding protein [Variovorax paradoxus]|nr:tripartite tricarboxylate transporter substrate binding protein [Variovorax paradoxus]MBT2302510.1 tripartite tricarboxylate transporter substrate binding protein [Variovorax paradoxus]
MNLLQRSLISVLAILALAAHAQEFPARPIRIIVPASVATTSDLTARFLADRLTQELKVPIVVENKTGSNGILAVSSFLAAPADGHTLLLTYSGLYANAALYKSVPYDPVKDFRILAGLNQVFLVLVASPSFPPDTVQQMAETARERPNQVTYASASVGSSTHLGPELLANRTGVKLRHVPYRGGAKAIADVAGGHVQLAMTALPTALPLIASGKLKALAVTGGHRSALLPQVPTLEQAGVPRAEVVSRQALVAHAGLPEAAASRLTAAVEKILETSEYAAFLMANGIEKEHLSPQAYARTGAEELRKWTEMVMLSGAKLE